MRRKYPLNLLEIGIVARKISGNEKQQPINEKTEMTKNAIFDNLPLPWKKFLKKHSNRSPFANCKTHIVKEQKTIIFKGDEYSYVHSCYECDKTGERFTTTAMDEENVQQVYCQYRTKYGIPNSDDIAQLIGKYGVSASCMSSKLGFDENHISNYIDGEVPNKAEGKTLSAIKDPYIFMRYVELAKEELTPSVYDKLLSKTKKQSLFRMSLKT